MIEQAVAVAEQILTLGALVSLIWAGFSFVLKLRSDAEARRSAFVSGWREARAHAVFHADADGRLTFEEFMTQMRSSGFATDKVHREDISEESMRPILMGLLEKGVVEQVDRDAYALKLSRVSPQEQGAALLLSNTRLAPKIEKILKDAKGLRLEELRGRLADEGETIDRVQLASLLVQMQTVGLTQSLPPDGLSAEPPTIYWRTVQ